MLNIKGVDVSTWQGANIDYNTIKGQGNNFVIARAGYGNALSFPKQFDNTFNVNYDNATKAGLDVGAYWYAYAENEDSAKREAESCISAIKGKKFSYPIFYDIEETKILNLGIDKCDKILKAFCDTLTNAGYYVGLYSSTWWAQKCFSKDLRNSMPLWVAEYGVTKCKYPDKFDIWQYGTENCRSASGGVIDSNICYTDFPTIIKNLGLNGFEKPAENKTKILQKIACIKADLNELERMI